MIYDDKVRWTCHVMFLFYSEWITSRGGCPISSSMFVIYILTTQWHRLTIWIHYIMLSIIIICKPIWHGVFTIAISFFTLLYFIIDYKSRIFNLILKYFFYIIKPYLKSNFIYLFRQWLNCETYDWKAMHK